GARYAAPLAEGAIVRTWIIPAAIALAACSTAAPADRGAMREGESSGVKDASSDAAIRDSPMSAAAYPSRGAARAQLGDFDAAIPDYTRALSLGPPDADVLYNRGVAMIAKQDYQGAIADLTLALSANPSHAKALFARGTARSLAGDPDHAQADWSRAIEVEPDAEERAN